MVTRIDILSPKVFCPSEGKNVSSDREKLFKFETEGQELKKTQDL